MREIFVVMIGDDEHQEPAIAYLTKDEADAAVASPAKLLADCGWWTGLDAWVEPVPLGGKGDGEKDEAVAARAVRRAATGETSRPH